MNDDPDLMISAEEEALQVPYVYGYNKQVHYDDRDVVEHVVVSGRREINAYFAVNDEFGPNLTKYMANVPTGICHYSEYHEPWVQHKLQLLYLPEIPPALGI